MKKAYLSLFFWVPVALAQSDLSTIRGTATDSTGAVVPNVNITILDTERNTTRTALTGQDGNYEIPFLVPGSYKLTATGSGFKEYVVDQLRLTSRETRRLDIALELGAVGTQVSVTAEAAAITTEGSQVAGGFNNTSFVDSPLSQSFFPQAYMTTLPNVQTDAGGWGLRFAGQSGNQINESLDGVVSDGPVNLVQNMFDFEELQVVAVNNSAEFSRVANFTMTGRGGNNQFHGRLYYDAVNSALNARSTFSPTKVPYKEHRGAGAVSGPIIKNKTFFYGSYSLVRIPSSTFFTRNVPPAAFRSGDFSARLREAQPVVVRDPVTGTPFPGNVLPASRMNALTQRVQNEFIPLPNLGGPEARANNYGFVHRWPLDLFKWDSVTGRVDHHFSDKNQIFGRYINRLTPYVLAGSFPNVGTWTRNRHHHSIVVNDTHTFSPTLVNTAIWGWIKDDIRDGSQIDGFTPVTGDTVVSQLGLQGVNPRGLQAMGFPTFNIVGVQTLRVQPGGVVTDRHDFEYANTTSWSKGSHVLKFGGTLRTFRNFVDVVSEGNYGNFTFNGVLSGDPYADFLLGLPTTSSRLDPISERMQRAYELGVFITDTWKATRRLTLDFGLRWDYFGASTFDDDLVYNWDDVTGEVVVPQDSLSKVSPLYPSTIRIRGGQVYPNPAKDNFRPRVGGAYRITNSFVLRGGYGAYTEALGNFHRLQGTGPFGLTETFLNQDEVRAGRAPLAFPNPFPSRVGNPVASQSVSGYPLRTDNGVVHQFNVSLEKEVARLGFRASYIGSRSRGLNYTLSTNKPQPSLTPFTVARRPYPQFVGTTVTLADGRSNYDSVQFEVKRTFGAFQFNAHYTLSNQLSDFLNLQNPYDHYFWNRDNFNSRNRVVATTIWDVPVGRGRRFMNTAPAVAEFVLGGWQTQTVHYFQSGQYFSPSFTGSDPSNTNTIGGLPDRIKDGNLAPGSRTNARWFDASAFAVPTAGRYGNSGVNVLEGPGMNLHHLSVVKEFKATERLKFIFQSSIANIFNTPHYTFPAANISQPGQVGLLVAHPGGGAPREKSAFREITNRLRIEF